MSVDEGVIKFDINSFNQVQALDDALIKELNTVRQPLFELKLIGEYPEINIGYGNISMRLSPKLVAAFSDASLTANAFIISGTQTGYLETLSGQHYTCVTDFNLKDNSLQVTGPIMASSESLTHGAIYKCHSAITAVIHIHSPLIWQGMLKDGYDQTSASIPYGTLEMANAVQQLVGDGQQGSIAMAGHEDGVVFYGPSMQAALSLCMEVYEKYVA